MILGIDYGSKTAGTTVLALYQDKVTPLRFVHTVSGHDADKVILDALSGLEPSEVFLDAPLSLPLVYKDKPGYQDYFYRRADRDLSAMSPMFLGGLTARAIALSAQIRAMGHQLYEAYPAGLAKHFKLDEHGYKKAKRNLVVVGKKLAETHQVKLNVDHLDDWHHVDALLCVVIGLRRKAEKAKAYGTEEEGIIWI
jgi:predicted nuclease with RNAse H fold